MDQEKRRLRQLKRDIKKAGNRQRRQFLKKNLQENPDEAAHAQFDFGRSSSASFNGNDQDSTRRRAASADSEGESGEGDAGEGDEGEGGEGETEEGKAESGDE